MEYMKKKIKKIGNSYGITFSSEERSINGLNVGTIVDLSDMVVLSPKSSQNGLKQELKGNKKEDDMKTQEYY